MTVIDLITSAQFVIDNQGHKKAVLLDVTTWEEIVAMLEYSASEVKAEAEAHWNVLLAGEASQNLLDQLADKEQTVTPSQFATLPDKAQASANQNTLALLHSLNEMGDKQEQQQTWAYLQQAVDKDRLSNRPLFI